jgi:hypothetical protein
MFTKHSHSYNCFRNSFSAPTYGGDPRNKETQSCAGMKMRIKEAALWAYEKGDMPLMPYE